MCPQIWKPVWWTSPGKHHSRAAAALGAWQRCPVLPAQPSGTHQNFIKHSSPALMGEKEQMSTEGIQGLIAPNSKVLPRSSEPLTRGSRDKVPHPPQTSKREREREVPLGKETVFSGFFLLFFFLLLSIVFLTDPNTLAKATPMTSAHLDSFSSSLGAQGLRTVVTEAFVFYQNL